MAVFLQWEHTAKGIETEAQALISHAKAQYDAVASVESDVVAFDNILKVISDEMRESGTRRNQLTMYSLVAPNKELRDASVEAEKSFSDFDVETSMRQDVFDNLVALEKKGTEVTSGEMRRLLKFLIRDGRRNGLHKSTEIQDEVKALKKEMGTLAIEFCRNLNEESSVLEFTEKELDGVSEALLKTFERTEDGKCKVTMKYPHYFPCIKKCHNPETRRVIQKAFYSMCKDDNTPLLEKLISLRHKKAQLLGYENHAAFMLENRMAKTPEKVANFLQELARKLHPLKKKEEEIFLKYKKEQCEKYGYKFDGKINIWDVRYCMTLVEEKEYAVNHDQLREYFPMDVVTDGLLGIYQELLGLTFARVEDAPVWHPDVLMFSVTDNATSNLRGYFYLDMHPRDGKYGHACCVPLQSGCLTSEGKRQPSFCAVLCNFTKPTENNPALLEHDEVETFFHEFGHAMHHVCSDAETPFFSGTRVETDFLEAPSQMLENWCWYKQSLSRMSSHYKTSAPIPDEEIISLAASRKANAGFINLRQILLGTFDQNIHTQEQNWTCSEEGLARLSGHYTNYANKLPSDAAAILAKKKQINTGYSELQYLVKCCFDQHIHTHAEADTAAVFCKLNEEIMGFSTPEGTNMPASFGHMAGGYDAQYYSYMWSEVFSVDMFMSRFHPEGIMNHKTGQDYRNCVLKPGGSVDAEEMLLNFLGRAPNQEAFLKSKGL